MVLPSKSQMPVWRHRASGHGSDWPLPGATDAAAHFFLSFFFATRSSEKLEPSQSYLPLKWSHCAGQCVIEIKFYSSVGEPVGPVRSVCLASKTDTPCWGMPFLQGTSLPLSLEYVRPEGLLWNWWHVSWSPARASHSQQPPRQPAVGTAPLIESLSQISTRLGVRLPRSHFLFVYTTSLPAWDDPPSPPHTWYQPHGVHSAPGRTAASELEGLLLFLQLGRRHRSALTSYLAAPDLLRSDLNWSDL